MVIVNPLSTLPSIFSTVPSKSANGEIVFGTLASKISSTRGKPDVISDFVNTPPVCFDLIVSWVDGSPKD